MSLIICKTSLILTWSTDCVISSTAGETKFAIADTTLYVPIVTLSTQDNAKLLEQLKSVIIQYVYTRHEQVCLMRLHFERYLSHHWAT